MKKLAIGACLISILLLTACQFAHPTETGGSGADPFAGAQMTEPSATDPTGKPSTTGTEPNETEAAAMLTEQFQELLGEPSSWYNMALTHTYESAADVDLYELFYNGFEGESQQATDAETTYLDGMLQTNWNQMDLFRLPVDKMDAVLLQYFGVKLEDTKGIGLDRLAYLEETNAYYCAHTDAGGAAIQVVKAVHAENGDILVFYQREYYEGDLVVTLRPADEGYQIISNLPVE